jgi:hypothetical protein
MRFNTKFDLRYPPRTHVLSPDRVVSTAGFRTLRQIIAEQMVAGNQLAAMRADLYDQDADRYVAENISRIERDPDVDVVDVERRRQELRREFVKMRDSTLSASGGVTTPPDEAVKPSPAVDPTPTVE